MDKIEYAKKIKTEIVELQSIQKILKAKTPSHLFLDPTLSNAIASLTDLLAYLEEKNPYYTEFNEIFFNNRMVAMHRFFFSDFHIATEEGLLKIIREKSYPMPKTKREKADEVMEKIIQDCPDIKSKLKQIIRLVPSNLNFNDYLNVVLNNIDLKTEYRKETREYFDALNVVRNKVSHSDTVLTVQEKDTLIRGKFSAAIVNEVGLQMSFQWYKILLLDIVRFFDTLYARL